MKKVSYRNFAIELANTAGKIIQTNFSLGMKKDWKTGGTPLTATDTTINELVIKTIQEKFPTHSVLGEEESSLKDSEYVWVCDPLDGTVPFSHGLPISAFSLALTKRGRSILGVVYDPHMRRMLVAEEGSGAYLNGKKVSVSSATEFSRTVIDVESWSSHAYDLNPLKQKLIKKGSYAVSLGAVVYAGMLVASGEFAATIFCKKTPWDAAALKIIIEEAGGRFTSLFGKEQLYNQEISGFIASNGRLHNPLVNLIKPLLTS